MDLKQASYRLTAKEQVWKNYQNVDQYGLVNMKNLFQQKPFEQENHMKRAQMIYFLDHLGQEEPADKLSYRS